MWRRFREPSEALYAFVVTVAPDGRSRTLTIDQLDPKDPSHFVELLAPITFEHQAGDASLQQQLPYSLHAFTVAHGNAVRANLLLSGTLPSGIFEFRLLTMDLTHKLLISDLTLSPATAASGTLAF